MDAIAHRFRIKTRALMQATNSTDAMAMYVAACDYLDALYVATEALRTPTMLGSQFFSIARSSQSGRTLTGLRYLRGPAVHESVLSHVMTQETSEIFYDHYGMWAWAAQVASARERRENQADYRQVVAGREVFLVAQEAYGAIQGLLGSGGYTLPPLGPIPRVRDA